MFGALIAAAALAASGAPCQEDAPCWTWSTMGDRKRGVLVEGERLIVTPCQFARLSRAHVLDAATPKLRGDQLARLMCSRDGRGS